VQKVSVTLVFQGTNWLQFLETSNARKMAARSVIATYATNQVYVYNAQDTYHLQTLQHASILAKYPTAFCVVQQTGTVQSAHKETALTSLRESVNHLALQIAAPIYQVAAINAD
jgi:hypothetical protein